MTITGTKIVNGRKVNVWEYTEEEKAEMAEKAEKAKEEFEKNLSATEL